MSLGREYRTFDGTKNNEEHPAWGAAGEQLLRLTPMAYADRKSAPALRGSTNPRAISNRVCREDPTGKTPNGRGLTDFMWAWGQFLDHEIDLTEPNQESIAVDIPADDPVFTIDPDHPERNQIRTHRSVFDPASGGGTGNPRQQLNQISAYIDATNVYGTDPHRVSALRRLDGTGRLEVLDSPHGDLLPLNIFQLENANPGQPPTQLFLAGDVRANEHAVLTAMHTLFVREHNRLCGQIVIAHPEMKGDDEQIFQRARQMVIGFMQAITYNEFLPALLGPDAIDRSQKYDTGENGGVDNLFSTATYRLGHSMLSSSIQLADGTSMLLRDAFFNPDFIHDQGVDQFLGGLREQEMQKIDRFAVEDVRSFLFGDPGAGAPPLDLAALNILRGRDHGLPDYNTCRVSYGLAPRTDFSQISSDVATQEALSDAYAGNIDQIDPWVGGLCEDHVGDATVGEFFFTVLRDQFARFRTSDRFWYEWDVNLTLDERKLIHGTRLSDIISRNTDLTISGNVFLLGASADPGVPNVFGSTGPDSPPQGKVATK